MPALPECPSAELSNDAISALSVYASYSSMILHAIVMQYTS